MELRVPPERVPTRSDADGVIRVGRTHVTLDTVVAAFDAGATAEEIVRSTPRSPWRIRTRSSRTTSIASRRSGRTSHNGNDELRRFARKTSGALNRRAFVIVSWPAAASRKFRV